MNRVMSFACMMPVCFGVAVAGCAPEPSVGYRGAVTPTPDAPFRGQPPPLAPATPLQLPPINVRMLANGLTAIVIEQPESAVVSFLYVNRAAHDSGRADEAGLAELTESAVSAATRLEDGRIVNDLQATATAVHNSSNRFGSVFELSAFPGNSQPGLAAFARVLRSPSLDADTLAMARLEQARAHYWESIGNGGIDHLAFEKLWGEGDTRALPSGVGYREQSFSDDEVRRFYHERYRPSQSALIVVGALTPENAFELLQRHFGDWEEPTERVPPTVLPPEIAPTLSPDLRLVGIRSGKLHVDFEVASPCPGLADPEYPAFEVLSALIDSSAATPLFRELRVENGGGGYYIKANCSERRDGGNFRLWFDSSPSNARAALGNVLAELERFQRGALDPSELEAAERAVAAHWLGSANTTSGFARLLAWRFLLNLPPEQLNGFLEQLRAVTSDRVRAVAQRYFQRSELVVALLANPAQVNDALSDFGKIEWRDPWTRRKK